MSRTRGVPYLPVLALIVAVLTALRLFVVWTTDLNLGPDEAQYWFWSLTPDWGYYSKPPLIAWVIGGATAVCGDGAACIRSPAALFHGGSAFLLFFAGRALYDTRTGFWAGLSFALMPGISFSSALITTDVPLLFFWSAALLCLALILKREPAAGRGLSVLMGVCLGLAMLSKYAGAYFLLGLGIALLMHAHVRARLLGRNGLLLLGAAVLVLSPNLIWNWANQFPTVSHTVWNAGLDQPDLFNPDRLAEFFGAQFGVLGPVLMGAILWGLLRGLPAARWPRRSGNDVMLLALGLPVIAAGLTVAFLSKANANWAAPAYASLVIVASAWLTRGPGLRLMSVSLGIGALVAVILYSAAIDRRVIEAAHQTNAFKLLRGWDVQGPEIVRAAREAGAGAILMEDREDMASALYYTRGPGLRIFMWTPAGVSDHFQMTRPFAKESAARVLFVTGRKEPADVLGRFKTSRRIGESLFVTAKNRERRLQLFVLDTMK